MSKQPLLKVENLHVSFRTYAGEVKAVRGVSFELEEGETLAIVGESGSGKSVTSQTIMRLLPTPPTWIKAGTILFNGADLIQLSDKEMEKVRGSEIGMIFQDPMTSLNPTMTIGNQIAEGLMKHFKRNKREAIKEAINLLELVGIPNPETRVKQYPHQFSGGMRQRAMIAISLACRPKLLIADEPTTALDVTIQAQILELMKSLQEKTGTSIILITHDLGVVAKMAHKVAVMYAGQIVEKGTVEEIFYHPQHPYTWGLMTSIPRLDLHTKGELMPIPGTPPDLLDPPKGCPFAARCAYAMEICRELPPETTNAGGGHLVSCWLKHPMAPKVKAPVGIGGGRE